MQPDRSTIVNSNKYSASQILPFVVPVWHISLQLGSAGITMGLVYPAEFLLLVLLGEKEGKTA